MCILLPEAEEKFARFIKRGSRAARHSVGGAKDGSAAPHDLSCNLYDLIILDLNLPGVLSRTTIMENAGDRSWR
jgi:DNA-binding response OmpR family regulator